ncbi:phosphotransferase enzyme family protein [Streptomyces sp. NPDC060194]|uniref:phosphotransferase enzyme family protein n=1 Tax=Streptomyces sp. NPDC060194 TaxID=3347069 RepID=UPI0036562ABA
MGDTDTARAVEAGTGVAAACGLTVEDALVLHASNKVTLRLAPCDVVARVAPPGDESPLFELELARRLVAAGCPVAGPDRRVEPRVYERDGFGVTLWTYHAPTASHGLTPGAYADGLARLHAGMREVRHDAPHFTERVAQAQQLVADHDRTPALAPADRTLLADTLRTLRRAVSSWGAPEQLLHGEPHPGNVLITADGPLFVDLETCCHGPVEFDLAHAPEAVGARYPALERELLHLCRVLALAVATTWRWDVKDRHPDGRELGERWLARIRAERGMSA